MAKRLCKMNRKQIADNLGEIHSLVVEPKFVCRSCARSAADKGALCKPAAIPPKQCQAKPLEEQKACGLLAEAIPEQSALRADKVRSVVERVKQKSAQRHVSQSNSEVYDLSDKKAIKRAKKAFKEQSKAQKKLIKLAKKQIKLVKKQKKLELIANQNAVVSIPESATQKLPTGNLH